jgi:nitroreductase
MDVSEAIRTMRAVRRFSDRPIPEEALRAILNAGRRAQSSKNTQPWTFIAVRDRETLRRLSQTGDYAGHLAGAAVGVVFATPNPTGMDIGQAIAFMQLAAWDLGIGSCIASIYRPADARAILGVPADHHLDVALSFGYPAADELTRPPGKGRRPLEAVVRWERFS